MNFDIDQNVTIILQILMNIVILFVKIHKMSLIFIKLASVHDKKGCDTMGERIGRIRRIQTDFS
jgi:hypothetical protein